MKHCRLFDARKTLVFLCYVQITSCSIFIQASPTELKNPVINAAFILLFKDLIRLFACYNDGIINLLGKFHSPLSIL